MENKGNFLYTEEQLMARLKFFIGVCLALTLTGIVFVVLYSLIFVTQPLNAISPIDQKFFELIVPIATFLTGTLSGIMLAGSSKEDQEAMLAAQKNAQIAADSAKTSSFKSEPQLAQPRPFANNDPLNSFAPTGFSNPMQTNPFGNSTVSNPFGGQVQVNASGKKIIPEQEQPLI